MKQLATFILCVLVLARCNKTEIDFERTNLRINNIEFEIITAKNIYNHYIKNNTNYHNAVYSKIKEEFSNNPEYPFIMETLKNQFSNNYELKRFTEKISGLNLPEICKPILQNITQALPGPSTKILFIPANPEYVEFFRKQNIGITAITVGSGKIIVSIDPFSNNWDEQLSYVLAHEYHHSVWTYRNFTTIDFTPLEYLIFEGRADVFANSIYPDIEAPWINIINSSQEEYVWNLIKPELNNTNSKYTDLIMIGNEEIPYASGYTIGYNIIKKFKKENPQYTDQILIDMDPIKILKLSNYDSQSN